MSCRRKESMHKRQSSNFSIVQLAENSAKVYLNLLQYIHIYIIIIISTQMKNATKSSIDILIIWIIRSQCKYPCHTIRKIKIKQPIQLEDFILARTAIENPFKMKSLYPHFLPLTQTFR